MGVNKSKTAKVAFDYLFNYSKDFVYTDNVEDVFDYVVDLENYIADLEKRIDSLKELKEKLDDIQEDSVDVTVSNIKEKENKEMENTNLKLSPPWAIFYQEINAMFKEDPDIKIQYDEQTPEVKLFVDNAEKADALMKLLPMQKNFGNVNMKITVIPADAQNSSKAELFKTAFKDNPAFVNVTGSYAPVAPAAEYVIFQPKVVQFYNDDLTDAHGYCSTLYQEIAKDIFGEMPGLYFCTDLLEVH